MFLVSARSTHGGVDADEIDPVLDLQPVHHLKHTSMVR